MNLSEIKKLKQKKYRDKFKMALVEGPRLISELEKTNFSDCTLYVSEKFQSLKSKFKKVNITKEQEAKISNLEHSQGILATVPLHNFENSVKSQKAIYLDRIQDPGNLGTIIRTAAWFGDYTVYVSENSCDIYNPKVIRSSSGGIFFVPIVQNASLEATIKKYEKIYAFDMDGNDITEMDKSGSSCLIFGNEGNGLSETILKDSKIDKIKISGQALIESLNIGTTASIAMHYMQVNK